MLDSIMRILMVDDEKGFRDIFYKTFTSWKYDVEVAENATQGVKKLRKDHFDVILLDIVIPKEEFEDNFRKIRKCNSRIPIIIMTGLTPMLAEGLFDREVKKGTAKVVYKPFRMKELVFDIEKVLEANVFS